MNQFDLKNFIAEIGVNHENSLDNLECFTHKYRNYYGTKPS